MQSGQGFWQPLVSAPGAAPFHHPAAWQHHKPALGGREFHGLQPVPCVAASWASCSPVYPWSTNATSTASSVAPWIAWASAATCARSCAFGGRHQQREQVTERGPPPDEPSCRAVVWHRHSPRPPLSGLDCRVLAVAAWMIVDHYPWEGNAGGPSRAVWLPRRLSSRGCMVTCAAGPHPLMWHRQHPPPSPPALPAVAIPP